MKVDSEKTNLIEQEKESFLQEIEKYKEYDLFMSCNIASENPNDYQKEQIKKMQNKTSSDLEGKNFSSIIELIKYMNLSIDNNFEDDKLSINFKDAFPQK